MNFDFSSDQKQLGMELRRLLQESDTTSSARRVIEQGGAYDEELWARLVDLGYIAAGISEEHGGLGAEPLELCVIAEELGRALAPVPVSSLWMAADLIRRCGDASQQARLLPSLAAGAPAAVALAEGPGDLRPAAVATRFAGGRLTGNKSPVLDGLGAQGAIVLARDEASALAFCWVDLREESVRRTPLQSIDPSRPIAQFEFASTPAERLAAGAVSEALDAALDRAAVLAAFEQVAGAERVLEVARDYALQRRAFGRLIGTFQALKHMLADMYVEATLARSNAYFAAWALATDAQNLPLAAATARVSAGAAFHHCARNALQVHGGVGFTWEVNCHLFYRRAALLSGWLGGVAEWERRLMDQLSPPQLEAG